jgi:hypothetical protein
VAPTAIWHNTYAAGYSNVGGAVSVAVVPRAPLLVSAEVFMDDAKGPRESAEAKPLSLAWHVGARTAIGVRDAAVELGAEYQHVDRWTYMRWNPYLAMYQRHTLPDGLTSLDESLGAPWGPDYDSIGGYARLAFKNGASLRLSYEFVCKGPIYQGTASRLAVTADYDGDPATPDTTEMIWVPVYYDYDRYAGPGALEAILSRPNEYRHLVALKAVVPLRRALALELSTTLGIYQNLGNVAGVTDTAILFYAGVVAHLPF